MNPRLAYLCEPQNSSFNSASRIIAIIFSYDEDGNIEYGASIFKRESKSDKFLKNGIRETALARFNNSPVYINMKDFNIKNFEVYYPKPCPQNNYMTTMTTTTNKHVSVHNLPYIKDVIKTIRKAMYLHGVNNKQ